MSGKFVSVLAVIAAPLVAMPLSCASTSQLGDALPPIPNDDHRLLGGCNFEPVAVQDGVVQFSFRGLSPSGNVLAIGWQTDQTRGAYLLDLDTSSRHDLPTPINNAASFSPDGQRLISASALPGEKPDIFELDLDTGSHRRISPHVEADFLPSYFTSGERIAFNSYRSGSSDIYIFRVTTGELIRITDDPRYEAYASPSPDESLLAFHRRIADGDYDVILLDLATGKETSWAGGPGEQSYPTWSPNGHWLVYSSNEDGQGLNLYMRSADGTDSIQLTQGPFDNTYPTWSSDGRYIFFNSTIAGQGVYRLALDDNCSALSQHRDWVFSTHAPT